MISNLFFRQIGRISIAAVFLALPLKIYAQLEVKDVRYQPCPHIVIKSAEAIEFDDSEITLMCGDDDVPGWQRVPILQAQYIITRALEQRGFLNPKYRTKDEKLIVVAGNPVRIAQIRVSGSPIDLPIEKYWYPRGKPMSSAVLNDIEAWIKDRLAMEGYPCPQLTMQASRADGFVLVQVVPGNLWKIDYIDSEPIPGATGGVQRRWDAFDEGDEYNVKELELTSRRMISHDLVLTNTFTPRCAKDDGVIEQSLTVGKPRLISFAVGFDTEEYLIGQFSWQHGRLFTSASRLRTEVYASYLNQRAASTLEWYYLPFPSRHYLEIAAKIGRVNEIQYEEAGGKVSVLPSWQYDEAGMHYKVGIGPAYSYLEHERGVGQDVSRLVSIDTNVTLESHDFEYYAASPRDGHRFALQNSSSSKELGSSVTASLWELSTTNIWNLGPLYPPIFIGVIRSSLSTTDMGDGTGVRELPPGMRHYLGGSGDLRGFGRRALPPVDNKIGALTSAYLGLDLRLNEILPYKLQPFAFVDVGRLGYESFRLNNERTFWSPGLGVRWQSPIGALKFSLGHGMIDGPGDERLDYLERWQFYFSFGERF